VVLAFGIVGLQRWFYPELFDPTVIRPTVGDRAADFALLDLEGQAVRLRDHVGRKPIVLEFGSLTCGACRMSQGDAKEKLIEKYQGKVDFWFIYCREAHAADDGPTPPWMTSYQTEKLPPLEQTHDWLGRSKHAAMFRSWAKTARVILIDQEGESSVQSLYNAGDLLTVVVNTRGRIEFRQPVALVADLDQCLERLVTKDP
jgi:hypothetical protein